MFLCKNYQYTELEKLIASPIKKFEEFNLEDLIEMQKMISSNIGTYLITKNDDMFCLLLASDKKLANKLGIKNQLFSI